MMSPPNEIDRLVNEGNNALKYGYYSDARSLFDQVQEKCLDPNKIKSDPQYIMAQLGLAESLIGLSRHDEAIEYLDRVLNFKELKEIFGADKRDQICAEASAYKGFALCELRKHEDAVSAFNVALKLNPSYPMALNDKGYSYLKLGHYTEALPILFDGLERYRKMNIFTDYDHAYALLLNNIGYAYIQLGQIEPAKEHLQLGLEYISQWEPKQQWKDAPTIKDIKTALLRNKGLALAYSGCTDKAIRCYKAALKANPNDINTLCYMGYALSTQNEHAEALNYFERALILEPNCASALLGKGGLSRLLQERQKVQIWLKTLQVDLLNSQSDLTKTSISHLTQLLTDFKRGLLIVLYMFLIQFAAGIVLITLAIVFLINGESALLVFLSGAAGGGVLLGATFLSSPMKLQKNRVDFAQWMIAYFNWINTFYATNALLTKELEDEDGKGLPSWETLKKMCDHLHSVTRETILIVESCCEFCDGTPKSTQTTQDEVQKSRNISSQEEPNNPS